MVTPSPAARCGWSLSCETCTRAGTRAVSIATWPTFSIAGEGSFPVLRNDSRSDPDDEACRARPSDGLRAGRAPARSGWPGFLVRRDRALVVQRQRSARDASRGAPDVVGAPGGDVGVEHNGP